MVQPIWVQAALGLLYLALGLALHGLERRALGPGLGAQYVALQGTAEGALADEEEESVVVPPSEEEGLPSEVPFERGRLDAPLCLFPCRTDAQRARWQLRVLAACVVLDPVTDIISIASFAAHGQPLWMLLTILAVGANGDAWQLRGLRAIHGSWQQGFPTRELLEVQRHEGGVESTICGAIVLHSVLTASPRSLGWKTVLLRLASAGVSFLCAMPNARVAEELLIARQSEGLDLLDYYAQEAARRGISRISKYGMTMGVLGFTTAAALSKEHPWWVEFCFFFSALPLLAIFTGLGLSTSSRQERERDTTIFVAAALFFLLFAAYVDWKEKGD